MTPLRSKLTHTIGALWLAGIAACGDNVTDSTNPDTEDPGPTATLSACEKVADPTAVVDAYPAVYDGTLELASSSISVGIDQCSVQIAPFGVETPGPDRVIALTNLNPGTEYVVRLFSKSDLAMYIMTSCDEAAAGPGDDGCLLFVDESVQPPERGRFIAPSAGQVSLVVDYFLAAYPVVGTFSVDVYEAECSTDDECSSGAGRCVDSRCVECANSYDCTGATTPICDSRTNTCIAGDDTCSSDDLNEGQNDGPAGATDVTPGETNIVSVVGNICNSPSSEVDYFAFEVTEAGASYELALDWEDAALDLDFGVFDSAGRQLGASLWRRPEIIDMTYLAPGTYYAAVNLFGTSTTQARPYTVTVTKVSTDGCETVADCAANYDTQLYRGQCGEDGACYRIENETPAALGDVCDTGDDCASGRCTAFSFTSDADTRSVCTSVCSTDNDCSGLGEFVCTDYLLSNMCVPKCESDDQCAVLIGNKPTCPANDVLCNIDPPAWEHLTCNTATGRCEF